MDVEWSATYKFWDVLIKAGTMNLEDEDAKEILELEGDVNHYDVERA